MKSLPQLTHCITLSRRSHAWRLKRVSCWTGWLARSYPQTRVVEANTKGLTRPQPYKLSGVDWKSGMSQCEAQSGCPNGSAFISWDMTLAHEYTVWRGDYSSPPMIWNVMTNHRTEDWIDIGYKRLHDTIIDWIWHLSLSWLEFLENCQVLLFDFWASSVSSAFASDCWLRSLPGCLNTQRSPNEQYGSLLHTDLIGPRALSAKLFSLLLLSALLDCGLLWEYRTRLYQICNHQTDQTSYTST